MTHLALLALLPLSAFAAPAVPALESTPCYQSVVAILKAQTNLREVDGVRLGVEFIDATDFTRLPVREYGGMNGDAHFGLVGYARIDYHGDATSHLYNYVVSATCTLDRDGAGWVLDDINLDGQLTKDDISLQDMDFERL